MPAPKSSAKTPADVLRSAIASEGCASLAMRAGISTSAIYTLIRQNRWPKQIRVKRALDAALAKAAS